MRTATCLVLLASLLPAQPTAPERLAVYYGWPSVVNGAGGNPAVAAATFAAYDRVVIGDGLQDPSHPDHANTTAIIGLAPATEFFGYIPLGQLGGGGLSVAQVTSRIAQWNAMGVAGIFLDEAGYDYGVTRAYQNDVVDAVHAAGLPAFLNAWDPDDAMSSNVVPTNGVGGGNPLGTAPHVQPGDRYLLESFQVAVGSYQSATFSAAKAQKALAGRAATGCLLSAVTTSVTFDQAQWDYAWWSALIWDLDDVGWGEQWFSAASASLPFRSTPAPGAMGASWLGDVAVDPAGAGVLHRQTDDGQVRVDQVGHLGSWLPCRMIGPAGLPQGAVTPYTLDAPGAGGLPFLVVASLTSAPGITLPDARVVGATIDPLMLFALGPNPVFLGMSGALDPSGSGTVQLAVPVAAGLTGFSFTMVAGVVDGAASAGLRVFSAPVTPTVL